MKKLLRHRHILNLPPAFKSENGFAMITIIFILVVIAAIGAAMAKLESQGSQLNNLSIQESRAYYAAASGLDWAVTNIQGNNCVDIEGQIAKSASDLYGSKITIFCQQKSYTEGTQTIIIHSIRSQATIGVYGTSPSFVSRQIESTIYQEL